MNLYGAIAWFALLAAVLLQTFIIYILHARIDEIEKRIK